jgi:hypothetical protein
MKQFFNDMAPERKSIDALSGHICIFDGYDKPRYILPGNIESGHLGVMDWGDVWNTPQHLTTTALAGNLTDGEYYAIIVVPANYNISVGGLPLYGNATGVSYPVAASANSDSITWTIPTEHQQYTIVHVGACTATTANTMEDSSQAWTINELAGYSLKNIETGTIYAITANSVTTITADGTSFTSGDRYNILTPFCTARLIYGTQGSSVTECMGGTFYLQDVIPDMTTSTWEMITCNQTGETYDANYYAPPNAKACKSIRGVLFCGGGVEERRGMAHIETGTVAGVSSSLLREGDAASGDMWFADSSQTLSPDALIGLSVINDRNKCAIVTDNAATEISPAIVESDGFATGEGWRATDLTTDDDTYTVTVADATNELSIIGAGETADLTFTPKLVGTNTITHADTTVTADVSGEALSVTTDTIDFAAGSGDPDYTSSKAENESTVVLGCPNMSGSALTSFYALKSTAESSRIYGYTGTPSTAYLMYRDGTSYHMSGSIYGNITMSSSSYVGWGGTTYHYKIPISQSISAGNYVYNPSTSEYATVTGITSDSSYQYFNLSASVSTGTVSRRAAASISASATYVGAETNPHAAIYTCSVSGNIITIPSQPEWSADTSVKVYVMHGSISSAASAGSFAIVGGNNKARITSVSANYFDSSGSSVYDTISAGDSVSIWPALFANSAAIGLVAFNGSNYIGTVTANSEGTVTLSTTHGITADTSVDFYSSSVAPGSLVGMLLVNQAGASVGLVTGNTATALTCAAHGVSAGQSFGLFAGGWTANQYADYVLKTSEGTLIGKVRSNTKNTMTVVMNTTVTTSTSVKAYSGGFVADAEIGVIISDGDGNIYGRVVDNSTSTLYLNATHALSSGATVYGHDPDYEGTVTTPTFLVVTYDGTDAVAENEFAGQALLIDPLGTPVYKMISGNAAASGGGTVTGVLWLSDYTHDVSDGEALSIYSGVVTTSLQYNWLDAYGTEGKVVRFAGEGGLQIVPEYVYAGDLVSTDGADLDGSGLDLDLETIVRIGQDRSWFEVQCNGFDNPQTLSASFSLTFKRNHVIGNTSGNNKTFWGEGLEDASIAMSSDSAAAPYRISWVDPVNQRLGLERLYEGNNAGADEAFLIQSSYGLYYSDQNNPHRFRAENLTDMSDNITAIGYSNDYLLLFCENSLWRIPYGSLGSQPELISDRVRCPAGGAVVSGDSGVMFYDGSGFSHTNGASINSVTAYRARDYMTAINKEYETGIVGVYNRAERRFEMYYPDGTSRTNNMCLYINEDSLNCYPVKCEDVRSVWDGNESGDSVIMRGSSARSSGYGVVSVMQRPSATTASAHTISSATSTTAQLDAFGAMPSDAGPCQVMLYHLETGEYEYLWATYADGVVTFERVVDASAGDLILYGYSGFSYGIKWEDFSSPQYRHQVRSLHIDLQGLQGELTVEHYLDLNEAVVQTNTYNVTEDDTKIIVPFRSGKGYTYGFRIRGYSCTDFRIHSVEIMFDTQA